MKFANCLNLDTIASTSRRLHILVGLTLLVLCLFALPAQAQCEQGKTAASSGNTATTSGGTATTSGGTATTSSKTATTSGKNATSSDIIELPADTLSQLNDIIEKAPFRIGFSIGIKHKDAYTSYSFGHQGPMYSASVIKMPIVLELYRRFQEGTLSPDTMLTVKQEYVVPDDGILPRFGVDRDFSLRELARLTIIPSDCTSSNMLLDVVGKDNVNALNEKMGLKDTLCAGKFFEVRPNDNPTNHTSSRDMVEFMRALDAGEVLADPWREEMIQMMHRQFYIEKIPGELPPGTWFGSKVGEKSDVGVRNDMAIILKGNTRIYLSAMTEEVKNNTEADRTISRLSRIVFDAIP